MASNAMVAVGLALGGIVIVSWLCKLLCNANQPDTRRDKKSGDGGVYLSGDAGGNASRHHDRHHDTHHDTGGSDHGGSGDGGGDGGGGGGGD